MPKLDFEYDDLAQFSPQVREALLRLSKQQEEKEQAERIPYKGKDLRILSRTTDAEQQKQVDSQRNRSGGIHLPPIQSNDLRLRQGDQDEA